MMKPLLVFIRIQQNYWLRTGNIKIQSSFPLSIHSPTTHPSCVSHWDTVAATASFFCGWQVGHRKVKDPFWNTLYYSQDFVTGQEKVVWSQDSSCFKVELSVLSLLLSYQGVLKGQEPKNCCCFKQLLDTQQDSGMTYWRHKLIENSLIGDQTS